MNKPGREITEEELEKLNFSIEIKEGVFKMGSKKCVSDLHVVLAFAIVSQHSEEFKDLILAIGQMIKMGEEFIDDYMDDMPDSMKPKMKQSSEFWTIFANKCISRVEGLEHEDKDLWDKLIKKGMEIVDKKENNE